MGCLYSHDIDAGVNRMLKGLHHTRADCDGVPALWLETPGNQPQRVLLYLHGGAVHIPLPAFARCAGGQLLPQAGAASQRIMAFIAGQTGWGGSAA